MIHHDCENLSSEAASHLQVPSAGPQGLSPRRRSWRRWLFIAPLAAVLWPPFFNHSEPILAGVPFFYAYLLGCAVFTALLTSRIYLGDKLSDAEPPTEGDDA